jgi:hypothetical protein
MLTLALWMIGVIGLMLIGLAASEAIEMTDSVDNVSQI